jgi:DNA helicase HerA-like ATPase
MPCWTAVAAPRVSARSSRSRWTEVHIRYARGEGVIVDGDLTPFHDALIRVATETEVQAWQQSHAQLQATLWLGDLALAAGVPCLADARGFSRHTFLCGQSGSGKTYSLGVILERLLIETGLRVVVLDPNSDFVRLGQVRSGADPVLAERYRQRAIRIAAEGRKFGLYLLVSTQRPQKIPQNVLSQADNLVLLRLNSLADAAFAQAVFSFVPPGLIQRSVTFRQGEGLIAGKISPEPALLRFGARISEEGGADVPATWASPR